MASADEKKELIEEGKFRGEVLSVLKVINDRLERMDVRDKELRGEMQQGLSALEEKTFRAIGANADRIGKLENWRWWLVGVGSVVVFIATGLANILFDVIKNNFI